MAGKVLEGPQLIRVGERARGDTKKFATDEYLLAPPGTIVAPRLRNEEPTPENAARAIIKKGQELGMLPNGGTAMRGGPPAYRSFATTAGSGPLSVPAKARGPRMLRKVTGAATGAAVNPVAEAMKAIQAVQSAAGVDPAAASGILNSGSALPPTSAPLAPTIPYAEGAGAMSSFLEQLLAGGQLTGPDLMLAQLAYMQSTGYVDPRAIGITDPVQFRTMLAEGKGTPTLDLKKQMFNESLFGFSQSSPQRGNVPQVGSQ